MLLIFLMFITLKRLTPIGEALFVGGGRREGNVFYSLISSFLDFVPHPQVKNEKKLQFFFYKTLIYWKLRTIEHILER